MAFKGKLFFAKFSTILGEMTVASIDGEYLCGCWFDDQKYYGGTYITEYLPVQDQNVPVLKDAIDWIQSYFSFEVPISIPKIMLSGTKFQVDVWENLQRIPYGCAVSYSEIGRVLVDSGEYQSCSMQSIGTAISRNPVSIIIPCHRVISQNKKNILNYAGGALRKRKILEIEKVISSILNDADFPELDENAFREYLDNMTLEDAVNSVDADFNVLEDVNRHF